MLEPRKGKAADPKKATYTAKMLHTSATIVSAMRSSGPCAPSGTRPRAMRPALPPASPALPPIRGPAHCPALCAPIPLHTASCTRERSSRPSPSRRSRAADCRLPGRTCPDTRRTTAPPPLSVHSARPHAFALLWTSFLEIWPAPLRDVVLDAGYQPPPLPAVAPRRARPRLCPSQPPRPSQPAPWASRRRDFRLWPRDWRRALLLLNLEWETFPAAYRAGCSHQVSARPKLKQRTQPARLIERTTLPSG